jgi:glyoxylase-like metal-dependent hydrolase (beta-lactamase superfamily II)
MNRRTLAGFALACGFLFAAASTRAQDVVRTADITVRGLKENDFPRMTKLAPNVYVYEELEAQGQLENVFTTNCFIVVTSDGVLVADGLQSPDLTERLVSAIAKITTQPIKYVVIGSDHGDHTNGNSAFPASATFIAHPTSKAALERRVANAASQSPAAHVPIPTETVSDKKVLQMGDTEIRILFLGRAHTGGDLEVYLPRENILYMSEAYFNRLFPSTYSSYPAEWVGVLRKAEAMHARIYVPAHGFIDSPQVLDEELVNFRTCLERLDSEGKRLHDAKVPLENAARNTRLGSCAYWTRAAYNLQDGLKRVYMEADGQLK